MKMTVHFSLRDNCTSSVSNTLDSCPQFKNLLLQIAAILENDALLKFQVLNWIFFSKWRASEGKAKRISYCSLSAAELEFNYWRKKIRVDHAARLGLNHEAETGSSSTDTWSEAGRHPLSVWWRGNLHGDRHPTAWWNIEGELWH